MINLCTYGMNKYGIYNLFYNKWLIYSKCLLIKIQFKFKQRFKFKQL